MIGEHQAAILSQLALAEELAQEAPTLEELTSTATAATGRSLSATRESVLGLAHGASIERVPEDSRKEWETARWRMSDAGRSDLAKWRARAQDA